MHRLVLQDIDGCPGCVLPQPIAEAMQLRAGDAVYAVEEDGRYVLTRADDEFAESMRMFNEIRREFRGAFRDLAR